MRDWICFDLHLLIRTECTGQIKNKSKGMLVAIECNNAEIRGYESQRFCAAVQNERVHFPRRVAIYTSPSVHSAHIGQLENSLPHVYRGGEIWHMLRIVYIVQSTSCFTTLSALSHSYLFRPFGRRWFQAMWVFIYVCRLEMDYHNVLRNALRTLRMCALCASPLIHWEKARSHETNQSRLHKAACIPSSK